MPKVYITLIDGLLIALRVPVDVLLACRLGR
jgi:hypothetical protein